MSLHHSGDCVEKQLGGLIFYNQRRIIGRSSLMEGLEGPYGSLLVSGVAENDRAPLQGKGQCNIQDIILDMLFQGKLRHLLYTHVCREFIHSVSEKLICSQHLLRLVMIIKSVDPLLSARTTPIQNNTNITLAMRIKRNYMLKKKTEKSQMDEEQTGGYS